MKLLSIFKKVNKTTVTKTETLNKAQLSKVIGGTDGDVITEEAKQVRFKRQIETTDNE